MLIPGKIQELFEARSGELLVQKTDINIEFEQNIWLDQSFFSKSYFFSCP